MVHLPQNGTIGFEQWPCSLSMFKERLGPTSGWREADSRPLLQKTREESTILRLHLQVLARDSLMRVQLGDPLNSNGWAFLCACESTPTVQRYRNKSQMRALDKLVTAQCCLNMLSGCTRQAFTPSSDTDSGSARVMQAPLHKPWNENLWQPSPNSKCSNVSSISQNLLWNWLARTHHFAQVGSHAGNFRS